MTQLTIAALRLCALVAVGTALVLVSMADAGAQSSGTASSWRVPRTPWGHPDFQGVWTGNDIAATRAGAENPDGPLLGGGGRAGALGADWRAGGAAPPAPAGGAAPAAPAGGPAPGRGAAGRGGGVFIQPPPHWLEAATRVTSQTPTQTPLGKQRASTPRLGFGSQMEGNFAGPEELGTWVRCITRGVPGVMLPQVYNNNYQIVQSPDSLVLMAEMIHDARVIPLTPKPRAPDAIRQWMGDSRGHWEGDTLVVEVTNFTDQVAFRGSTEKLRLVERYTRTGPDALLYQATLEDPAAWTAPWSLSLTFTRDRSQDYVFEYACHEGNYGLRNILSASRATDAESAR